MDQQKRTTGAIITAAIMFFCAFIFLCLGSGMAFSYPDKVWIWGIILLGCCVVMIYSGISNLRLAKNIEQDSITQLQNTATSPVSVNIKKEQDVISPVSSTVVDEVNILARWEYSKEEWQQFLKRENKERKNNSTLEATVLVVLGLILLRNLENTSWTIAIGASVVVGIIYLLGKYFLSIGSIGVSKNNEVIITSRSVIINGKVNTFIDGQYWLKEVSLKEEASPAIIEFVYCWQTRNPDMPAHDEIRIPVPKEKLPEAVELVKQF
jgi:hypothetical protein